MIHETEVDGVPTFVAPGPGPLTAGLVFRVGRADETLASSGVSHLVEHLALHRHGLTDYHYNGATATAFTMFHAHGTDAEVASFLGGVCDALADLPLDRLETEKEILRTEAAGRSRGANGSFPLWRYGTTGYGLASAREWGAFRLTAEDVRGWAEANFTRQNAALWIAGDAVPAGLRLSLPMGRRRPMPKPTSTLPKTPAYFTESRLGVVLDAVVPDTVVARVYTELLRRELARALRHQGGYSATVDAAYEPRYDGYATITAAVDSHPDTQGAALGAFVDVLARLRLGSIDDAELAKLPAERLADLDHPEANSGNLFSTVMNTLTGRPPVTLDEIRTQLAAVTPQRVQEVAALARETALLRIPDGYTAEWAAFTPAPAFSESSVEGAQVDRRDVVDEALVLGDEGVSMLTPEGPLTVRYAGCQAHLRWPDGARRLIGSDGITVTIEPTLWQLTSAQLAALDAGVSADVVVPQPARDPQDIPQPDRSALRGRKSPAPRVSREPLTLQRGPAAEQRLWSEARIEKEERISEAREVRATRSRHSLNRLKARAAALGVLCLLALASLANPHSYTTGPLLLSLLTGSIVFYRSYQRYENNK